MISWLTPSDNDARSRTFDEIAAGVDDVALAVEELRGVATGVKAERFALLKALIEQVKDLIDEIAEVAD